jgi:hypothetical protein
MKRNVRPVLQETQPHNRSRFDNASQFILSRVPTANWGLSSLIRRASDELVARYIKST